MKRWMGLLVLALIGGGCTSSLEQYGFTSQEWRMLSKSERQAIIKGRQEIVHHDERFVGLDASIKKFKVLSVSLDGGSVLVWPEKKRCYLQPTSFKLKQGQCEKVRVNVSHGKKALVSFCYQSGVLLIDPSTWDPTKRYASAYIYQSVIWRRGMRYQNVFSSGHAALENVNVFIKA